MLHVLWNVVLIIFTTTLPDIAAKVCTDRTPLGMSNGFIHSNQLSALSIYRDDSKYNVSQARLNVQSCWCSKGGTKIGGFKDEWFQVSFKSVTIVNGLSIQGHPERSYNYIKSFKLVVSNDSMLWTDFDEFVGNANSNDKVYNWFQESMVTTHIRFYATDIQASNSEWGYSCLRMELYGCVDTKDRLEPLGMQLGIIKDAQVKGLGVGQSHARLYNTAYGIYRYYTGELYLIIDLKLHVTMMAVAMQGYPDLNFGFVKTYRISVSNNSKDFRDIPQTFVGNDVHGTDPVLAMLPSNPIAQVFQIKKLTFHKGGSFYYMKVELYGRRTVCSSVLQEFTSSPNSSRNILHTPADAYIDSPITWCTGSSDDKYIHVKFKNPVIVGGIAIQGDSEDDNWVTKFKVATQYNNGTHNLYEDLIGNNARIFPQAIHWFQNMHIASDLWINPLNCNGLCCLRFSVKGCNQVMSKPHSLSAAQDDNELTISWDAPVYLPIAVTKYVIKVSATKHYNITFQFNVEKIVLVKTVKLSLSFGAASLHITVQAHIGDYFQSEETLYKIYAEEPYVPFVFIKEGFDGYAQYKNISLSPVPDVTGPISHYEVIISSSELTDSSLKSMQLFNQDESKRNNLQYFLAGTFNPSQIKTNLHNILQIVNGQEKIDGVSAKLSTIGTYHMYIRAVTLKKDIEPEGFGTTTYFGKSFHTLIERKSLANPVFKLADSFDNKMKITLVEGPINVLSYQVIVMKINKTSLVKSPTSHYVTFKSYKDAGYNELYITTEFNASMFSDLKKFTIGDGAIFKSSNITSRKRRSLDTTYFENGPLVSNETYMFYQRVVVTNGTFFTSPWSLEFVASSNKAPIKDSKTDSSSNTSVVVGIICAVVVIILIVLVIVILFRRRKMNRKQCEEEPDLPNHEMISVNHVEENAYASLEDKAVKKVSDAVDEECYYNLPGKPKFPPIPVADFSSFYLQNKDVNDSDITKQFKSVPLGQIHACDVALQNKTKNRYQNIIAYDHTRVKLPLITGEKNDYINANYIQGCSGTVAYIAAQAPKNDTIFDFWRMIIDQKPSAVIMLTNLKEGDKVKCVQYWPEKKRQNYHEISVEVLEDEHYADYIVRKMLVMHKKTQHSFIHMHFTSWPDHGCPEYPTMLLNFYHRFRSFVSYDDKSKVIVHCSAGVGRTGTFIVIDAMIKLIKEKNVVDIYNYFENIRQDRFQMIQTIEQYFFTYNAIYEVITCGYTGIAATSFQAHLKDLLTKKSAAGKFLMQDEFSRLNDVTPVLSEGHYATAVKADNTDKNRHNNILPRESALLSTTLYINAVYVDGYKLKNTFIATQAPMRNTVPAFWQAVLECNVTTLVMLFKLDEESMSYPMFWPTEKDIKFNNITVKLIGETEINDLSQRRFVVQGRKSKSTINILQMINWKDHDIPNAPPILTLMEEILKSQQSLGNGKIMVVCSDGANRSGTFIACMNALSQLKVEQHVDVFQTVRRMRLVRPEFVENLDEYFRHFVSVEFPAAEISPTRKLASWYDAHLNTIGGNMVYYLVSKNI